jgi:3-hydroxymyristoyl/3-hydroxydecanoyl-(acyl carrier protein) dehydratase
MYAGHFPDLAVMPGVVQLQLIEELLSKSLNHNLRLKSSKNIKFLKMILPTEFQIIKIVLTWKIDELIQLQAEIQSLHELPSIITKYQAQFEIIR